MGVCFFIFKRKAYCSSELSLRLENLVSFLLLAGLLSRSIALASAISISIKLAIFTPLAAVRWEQ